jgi:Flp pilus assembly pilin Flp
LAGVPALSYDLLKTSLGIKLNRSRFGYLFPVGLRGVTVETDSKETELVANFLKNLWSDDSGQDIAEYAVMLAVILVIVVGTIRLIGSNANNVFSNVASAVGQ